MTDAPHRLRKPALFATIAVALFCSPVHGAPAAELELLSFPEWEFEPLQWPALEGWLEDDHAAAFAAFQASCKSLVRSRKWRLRMNKPLRDTRPMRAALTDVCEHAVKVEPADAAAARAFFEEHFRPVRVGKLGEETGLLTGYYEPIIEGSRFPSYEYTVPVYGTPSNLVVGGRRWTEGEPFPNKGRVGRLIGPKKTVPYYDRGEIEDGVLAGRGLEICWVKDPVDAFFMQIQGSARVKLDTGKTLRLNYAAHNGHSYTPVGRILIERKEVPKEEMSMDRIRQWMEAYPEGGKELRRANRSYVFMRETGLADDVEPTGAQGIPLTAGRSIAVDKTLHIYGTPFFVSAHLPIEGERAETPFRRLMVAQDTGSAIVGIARADIYFGAGEEAGQIGGRIKQQGRFVMLVPKPIDPTIAYAGVPAPYPRPRRDGEPAVLLASAQSRPAALAYAPTGKAPASSSKVDAILERSVAVVPTPIPRPGSLGPPLQAEPVPAPQGTARLPDWLLNLGLVSSAAAEPMRSFASTEAAISAALSAPAAFAAPALTYAAASMLSRRSPRRRIPLPPPRPHGIASVAQ